MRGADRLIEALIAEGADCVFGLPGGACLEEFLWTRSGPFCTGEIEAKLDSKAQELIKNEAEIF